MTRILLFLFFLVMTASVVGQTSLTGKVTDAESGEAVPFGNVVLFKNGVFITGTETDLDGNYNFNSIDPGTYDVEVSFIGYQTQRITGIQAFAGKANRADVALEQGGGVVLDEIVVREYKVPLVEQDNTTSGGVITSDQIRNLPTRNINALAATTAGLSSSDEGGAITIRGSRSDATDYYVDGVRVRASGNVVLESEVDQLQVITGGVEAQYGDVSGGVISITTKGTASEFSGGVEIESSNLFDPYNNSLLGFNLTGPLLKNKDGESILGFRVSGRITDQVDDDPPAIPVYRVKGDVLSQLEENPIIDIGGSPFVAADFLTNDDVDAVDAKPFEDFRRYDFNAKIDARVSDAIDVSLIGYYIGSKDYFTPGGWRVYNSHNNPYQDNETLRGSFRLRHRLGGASSGGAENRRQSLIQNASYTLQFTYENLRSEQKDERHGDRFFDYGYVGNFDIEWVPTFLQQFDPATGNFYLQHTDYRQVLRGYTPGTVNPVLANYNKAMGINFEEGINGQIGNSLITNGGDAASGALSRAAFYAPNGTISGIFTNSWNFHTNVGTVYNLYNKGSGDTYTFNATTNFDLIPGGSDKGRHSIQLGIWYEQRINRGYSVSPRSLWDIARQQANIHIQGIPENADTIGVINVPGFEGTPLLGLSIAPGDESQFYRRIREVTGQSLTEFVNVDGLSPDQLGLDLFSAKELNDQQVLGYFGYDYLGNNFDGTFEDFFTARDADGIRTFPIAPDRPIYSAAYIQDKFTFRDIIFRLGVRVDRFDANTKVLKDNYSLYDILGAEDYHTQFGGERPGNIGDDYKVYLDESGSTVTAYRDGDQWFADNGTPVNNPATLFSGGLVFPKYADDRVDRDLNFIKSPDFDVNASFEDYEVQVNVMPRLAFSFPISNSANFFAHYDILVQRPSSNYITTARDYFYFFDISYGPNNPINNPNLKPSRTISYEVGFQQLISNTSAIKIAAYYRELRDMIQIRTFFPVPTVIQYTTYDNQDFGTVKGFSFQYDLRRTGNISLLANYTLQFADGTGSNANSQRGLTSRGNLRTLFPLNFDERHRFNVNLDYRYASGRLYNGPRLFGADIFANAGASLQGVIVSGRPYTANQQPTEFGGVGTVGAINGARLPWTFTLNLRVDKSFAISDNLNFNVYCRVSNLLDRRNIIGVYSVSGSPDDSGFLASSFGEQQIQNIETSVRNVDSYLASYQWALLNPNLYSLPRRIFVGAIMDF